MRTLRRLREDICPKDTELKVDQKVDKMTVGQSKSARRRANKKVRVSGFSAKKQKILPGVVIKEGNLEDQEFKQAKSGGESK